MTREPAPLIDETGRIPATVDDCRADYDTPAARLARELGAELDRKREQARR